MSHILSIDHHPISPSEETPDGGTYWQLGLEQLPAWLHTRPFDDDIRRGALNELHLALQRASGISAVSITNSNQPGLEFSVCFMTTPPSEDIPPEVRAEVEAILEELIWHADPV